MSERMRSSALPFLSSRSSIADAMYGYATYDTRVARRVALVWRRATGDGRREETCHPERSEGSRASRQSELSSRAQRLLRGASATKGGIATVPIEGHRSRFPVPSSRRRPPPAARRHLSPVLALFGASVLLSVQASSEHKRTMPRAKKKKPAVEPASRGLDARRLARAAAPTSVMTLARTIEDDGGTALASYRDPLGGHWQILASLPIDRVEPTPFQRDLSETHVERLAGAIDKLDRFLDPVIAVPAGDGKYWSPNGYHRLGAMKQLGAKSIVALVVPEVEVAHRILLLNTEKAHNLRERALEVA